MSDGTAIQWTDASWNPLRAFAPPGGATQKHGWACVRVSQGCVNCYASTINKRLGTGLDYTVPALAKVKPYLDMKTLDLPLKWRKPRKVFVCSMTDLFGEWVTDSEIAEVFGVMARAPRHTFQVLTKRPERMRHWVADVARFTLGLPNVWLGTSVENQESADERIPYLLTTPAAIRFLSCEPLLGPVTLMSDAAKTWRSNNPWSPRPDWVIVGGESGHRARQMELSWARSLRDEVAGSGAAFFMKQMGSAWAYDENAAVPRPKSMRDSHGGDPAEWPEDLRVREWPVTAIHTSVEEEIRQA